MHDRGGEVLFALADGLGGMGGGQIASQLAIRSVMGQYKWTGGVFSMEAAMETAQNAVFYGQRTHPDADNMSSTLVLLSISGSWAIWAHVGDSRLYFFRKGKVQVQTEDHSVPQMLVRMGEIREEQIREHPDRNRLLKTLGWDWGDNGYTVSEGTRIQRGDAFLLCSDGFWELITEREMISQLKANADAAGWLQSMCRIVETNGEGKDMDNYSAICVMIL